MTRRLLALLDRVRNLRARLRALLDPRPHCGSKMCLINGCPRWRRCRGL